ncbi:MAG: hypothetical protein L0922_04420, partial [Candidatus Mariimomonas ferrooxydans]
MHAGSACIQEHGRCNLSVKLYRYNYPPCCSFVRLIGYLIPLEFTFPFTPHYLNHHSHPDSTLPQPSLT